MNPGRICWWRAIGGAVAAEVAQVVAAFAWVAVYSHAIAPGEPFAHYEAHAQASGPWVSIVAGLPIFYAASRWLARSRRNALALYAVFLTVDLAIVVVAGVPPTPGLTLLFALSYATKLVACIVGGRHAERPGATHPTTPAPGA